MKLAFIAAANSPHTIKWVNCMVGLGHEVKLFSLPDHKDSYGEVSEKANVSYLPFSVAQKGFKKNASQLKAYLAADNFDACVAFGLSCYGFMASKAGARKLLLVSTGIDILEVKQSGGKGPLVKSIKHAGKVAAASHNVISLIKEVYKKEAEYFTVPFGVDMELFKPAKTGLGETPCFASVKFLERRNNVGLVIEAFGKYVQTHGGARLKIIGDGSLESELKRKAQDLGVSDSVECAGYVKNADMPGALADVDVMLQMTDEECLGVSGIEAMAMGIPMVASDTHGASEYILNGVTGYLVKRGNTDACADKMASLLKDGASYEKMGALCRDDVKENYDLTACAEKFIKALKA